MPTKLSSSKAKFNPLMILIIGLLALAAGVVIYLKASAAHCGGGVVFTWCGNQVINTQ